MVADLVFVCVCVCGSGNADSAKRYRSGEDYGYSGHESASKRLNVGAGAHGGSSAGGASGDYH